MTAHPPTHMPHHLASMPCAPPSPSAASARQLTSSTSRSSLASMSHMSRASTSLSNISHSSVLASSVLDHPERPPVVTALPLERRGSSSTNTASAPSSASASKSGSFIGTARLLSRHSSTRERERPASAAGGAMAARSHSVKGKARDDYDGLRSPQSEADVIETPQLRLDRDPETGRKMINQYLVLEEIGHGTHGRVRLGMDMTIDPDEEHDLATGGSSTRPRNYYAIKIVERNPKKKRLAGLQRGTRNEGAKRVAENEIRKEIAIFKKVHHPNVVRMKEIIDDPESSKLFMILEYCAGGEVKWKGRGAPALTIAETRKIFRDTLLGLEYLHHQGIIHRDIKPSNLLISGDHVKIADFGCSHFSEALVAASWAHDGGEAYVDDIELAKTAGSPAFFAPEMCYSELPDDLPQLAAVSPTAEVPTFTLRPPSTVVEEPSAASAAAARRSSEEMPPPPAPRPLSEITNPRHSVSRSVSASTVPKGRPRHPITNAIDVWALGVTLYCLLFGKTPFDAANEYLLMQVIPTQAYEVPRTMGREALPTGSNAPEQVKEALDLLSRLLVKDAPRRITLEQAKRHPFTLRDLPDPQGWLAKTDPHAQSYVTVTNDEVAAAVTRQSSIRDKVRQRFKSIGNRLGIFSSNRHRSHSVTDSEANDTGSSGPDAPTSQSSTRRVASGNDLPTTPVNGGSLARRLSLLTRDRAQSPRPGLLASALDRSSPPHSEGGGSNGHGGGSGGGSVSVEEHLRLPHAAANSADATPRQVPSLTSLDRWRAERGEGSPGPSTGGHGLRKQSVDLELRPRSGSNASSSAGSILGVLGRNIFNRSSNGDSIPIAKRGSMRSSNGHHPGMRSRGYTGSSEDADNVFASSIDSHAMLASSSADGMGAEFLRGRSFDNMLRRQSMDTFESGSPSSLGGGGHIALQAPSPERANGWDRFGRPDFGASARRGSTLSEDIRPVIEDEEFDWTGNVPDSDDDEDDGASSDEVDGLPAGHGFKSAPADWNLSEAVVSSLTRKQQARWSPTTSPVRARMAMAEAQSILRPSGGIDLNRLGSGGTSAAGGTGAVGVSTAAGSAATGFRVPPSAYRAKSPLASEPTMHCGARTASGATTPDRFQDAEEDDEDDGLVLGLRRGRKGSSLSRHSSVRGRSSPMLGRSPQSPP